MAEAEKLMQWGYKADGSSQQFPADEALPKGWSTDPNVIKDPAKRTAEAISGTTTGGTEYPGAADLATAEARIAELEAENTELKEQLRAARAAA